MRLHRFRKEAVHRVTEHPFEPRRDTARRSADSARNIDKERMLRIYDNLLFIQLFFQPSPCCGIAKEEVLEFSSSTK